MKLFLLLSLALTQWTAFAQTGAWVQVGYSSAPAPRSDSGIAYEEATHSTVLFGGANFQSIYGDTWTWDGAWHAIISASSPSPRQGAALAFDGAAHNIVLFGGSPTAPVGTGTAFGDTWTWDGTRLRARSNGSETGNFRWFWGVRVRLLDSRGSVNLSRGGVNLPVGRRGINDLCAVSELFLRRN
jgi:hypothetical protein